MRPLSWAVLVVLAGAGLPSGACGSTADLKLCGQIRGKLPIGRGGTCEDETCAGLYDCVEGKSVPGRALLQRAGGAGGSAVVEAARGPAALYAGAARSPGGADRGNCKPDLQDPDCPQRPPPRPAPRPFAVPGCVDFFPARKTAGRPSRTATTRTDSTRTDVAQPGLQEGVHSSKGRSVPHQDLSSSPTSAGPGPEQAHPASSACDALCQVAHRQAVTGISHESSPPRERGTHDRC